MLFEAVGQGIEIFEKSIDDVVPSAGRFAFSDRHNALGSGKGARGGIEILVGLDQDGFSRPIASLGNAEEVKPAHSRLSPAAFAHSQLNLRR